MKCSHKTTKNKARCALNRLYINFYYVYEQAVRDGLKKDDEQQFVKIYKSGYIHALGNTMSKDFIKYFNFFHNNKNVWLEENLNDPEAKKLLDIYFSEIVVN